MNEHRERPDPVACRRAQSDPDRGSGVARSAAAATSRLRPLPLGTGLPLLRVTLHCGTLHPQFLGATYTWWRTSGPTRAVMIAHEVADLIPYADNPVRRVSEGS
jgi:hypothetical protein